MLTLALDIGICNFAACLADAAALPPVVRACVLRRIGSPKDKIHVLIAGLLAVMGAEPAVFAPPGLRRVVIEQQNGRMAPINHALSCVLFGHYASMPGVEPEFQHPRRKFTALRASDDPALAPLREMLAAARGKDLKRAAVAAATALAEARGCEVTLTALREARKRDDLSDCYLMIATL